MPLPVHLEAAILPGGATDGTRCLVAVADLKHAEQELERARDAAQAANRAKSAFWPT